MQIEFEECAKDSIKTWKVLISCECVTQSSAGMALCSFCSSQLLLFAVAYLLLVVMYNIHGIPPIYLSNPLKKANDVDGGGEDFPQTVASVYVSF